MKKSTITNRQRLEAAILDVMFDESLVTKLIRLSDQGFAYVVAQARFHQRANLDPTQMSESAVAVEACINAVWDDPIERKRIDGGLTGEHYQTLFQVFFGVPGEDRPIGRALARLSEKGIAAFVARAQADVLEPSVTAAQDAFSEAKSRYFTACMAAYQSAEAADTPDRYFLDHMDKDVRKGLTKVLCGFDMRYVVGATTGRTPCDRPNHSAGPSRGPLGATAPGAEYYKGVKIEAPSSIWQHGAGYVAAGDSLHPALGSLLDAAFPNAAAEDKIVKKNAGATWPQLSARRSALLREAVYHADIFTASGWKEMAFTPVELEYVCLLAVGAHNARTVVGEPSGLSVDRAHYLYGTLDIDDLEKIYAGFATDNHPPEEKAEEVSAEEEIAKENAEEHVRRNRNHAHDCVLMDTLLRNLANSWGGKYHSGISHETNGGTLTLTKIPGGPWYFAWTTTERFPSVELEYVTVEELQDSRTVLHFKHGRLATECVNRQHTEPLEACSLSVKMGAVYGGILDSMAIRLHERAANQAKSFKDDLPMALDVIIAHLDQAKKGTPE